MEDQISRGLYSGRPFGGVSISWSPCYDNIISPISNFRHKRIVAVELDSGDEKFLIICVYMPFYNTAQRAECLTETMDAIAMLENIIEQHPHHHIIIGGDFNTEMKGESPFDPLWEEFSDNYRLSSCDHYFPNSTVTYKHNSLDHKKWSDHFLVSASLSNADRLSEHEVIDEGDNLSDHFPIIMSLMANIQNRETPASPPTPQPKLKWEKISNHDKSNYTTHLHSLVSSTPQTADLSHCQNVCRCRNSECHEAIQREYDCLVNLFKVADCNLPRFKRTGGPML